MTVAVTECSSRTVFSDDLLPTQDSVPQCAEVETLLEAMRDAQTHFFSPYSAEESDLRRKFDRLAEWWRNDTLYMSSIHDMVLHPAYQHIIGMGRAAVPFLLHQLRLHPDHWFWALHAITGDDPVPPSDRGEVDKMARAWVSWGYENGYL